MILAVLSYLALQVDHGVRAVLRGFGGASLVIILLLTVAAVALGLEGARVQPIRQSVDDLRDGVSTLTRWVRMEGDIVTLTSPRDVAAGRQVQSLLIEPSGDAILLTSHRVLEGESSITGRIALSADADETARRVGGPRIPDRELEIVDRYVITVDAEIVPPEQRSWLLAVLPLAGAALLAAGRRIGYPVILRRRRPGPAPDGSPLRVGEAIAARLVEPERETGPRLAAPAARLERLERDAGTDAYFRLTVEGRPRPMRFMRHRWATATPGMLWTVLDRAPILDIHDWATDALLAFDSVADRDRVLASFAPDRSAASSAAYRPPAD